MPIPLLLLKTRSSPSDPYDTFFAAHPFRPRSGGPAVPFAPVYVPVLRHHPINAAALEALIVGGKLSQPGGAGGYSALIITSQRAVEALSAVLVQLGGHPHIAALFTHTTVYVVGPATASAVAQLGFAQQNILGSECGSGEALAEFIVAGYTSASRGTPILFLVGETRRDVIPRRLRAAGIGVEELVIYETTVAGEFRGEFESAVRRTQQMEGRGRWIVVFSPAGADVAVEVLREHRAGAGEGEGESWVAAIGPTTEKCLTETLERPPEVVAARPSPQGLWEAVTGFMMKDE